MLSYDILVLIQCLAKISQDKCWTVVCGSVAAARERTNCFVLKKKPRLGWAVTRGTNRTEGWNSSLLGLDVLCGPGVKCELGFSSWCLDPPFFDQEQTNKYLFYTRESQISNFRFQIPNREKYEFEKLVPRKFGPPKSVENLSFLVLGQKNRIFSFG